MEMVLLLLVTTAILPQRLRSKLVDMSLVLVSDELGRVW